MNKIKVIIIGILALTGTAFLLSSCEKKVLCDFPHPHDKHICHTPLTFTFDTKWEEDIMQTYADKADIEKNSVQYIVEYWTLNEDNLPETLLEHTIYNGETWTEGENSITIDTYLPAMKVAILCWAQPIAKNQEKNPNFNTENLLQVSMNSLGATDLKDAFTASLSVDYTAYAHEYKGITLPAQTLKLQRPFGKYKVISNDLETYFTQYGPNAELPATTQTNYSLWVSRQYNVYSQRSVNGETNMNYTAIPKKLSEKHIQLNEDLIFIGTADNTQNIYYLNISSYNASGELIHNSGSLTVGIQRNHTTLVYAPALTEQAADAPTVDDSFDDEIIVEVP